MARVTLSEYRAKQLLVNAYEGVSLHAKTLDEDIARLADGMSYVIKVDQGIKKRGKQGLIQFDVTKASARQVVAQLRERGFEHFVAEPMLDHTDDEERYVSIERVRDGWQYLYSERGGVDVESQPASMIRTTTPSEVPLPPDFLRHITDVMDREHMSFVEINPLVVRDEQCLLLDAAVLVDSAATGRAAWTERDIVQPRQLSAAEQAVAQLNEGSAASFSLRILNPDGALWLLLSGGGASICLADEAANAGKAALIGNYGEYSGGPTREETRVYTEAVLDQLIKATAPRKALIIAGGVANFTDVKKTFSGVIDALRGHIEELQRQQVRVFVRRGGPNEKEGLALMEAFLKEHDIFGSIHGSDAVLTTVIHEALEYVDA